MKPMANYMPPEQFNQVIDAIPRLHIRKWKDEDIQMLFKLCYWCGLRISEAMKLSVEDFDVDHHQVFLGQTKTEKLGYATISPLGLSEVRMYLMNKQGLLFPELTYGTVYKWIYRLGEMLHIKAWETSQKISGEKTKTHIFRKTIGKDMMWGITDKDGRKAPLNVISEKLRHKGKNPLATTYLYLKMGIEGVKDWEYPEEKKDEE